MKKLIAVFAISLVFVGTTFSQEHPRTRRTYDFELSDMARRIIPVLSFNANMHEENWVWKEGRSSALVEKGKPADFYEINKLSDLDPYYSPDKVRNVSTAWVEGVKGDGIGEWVIIPVEPTSDAESNLCSTGEHAISNEITLYVKNGYQQSEDLYKKNNRVKEAKVSVYAAAYGVGQDEAFLIWNPECVHEEVITLSDEITEHPFWLNSSTHSFMISLPEKYCRSERPIKFFLKFEILSVYKGSKYDDTCICDMSASVDIPM